MKKSVENLTEWDISIAAAKLKRKSLLKSIRTFEKMRDAGEPWPGFSVSLENEKAPAEAEALESRVTM